ncbi:hypothetical protein [Actinomyces gerencseriae]|uniref:hypothetical protein n=1 Tax=Actinomyces gerencseriae TaxID=52769 RepID=UPI0028F15881|nr:hypothetical protein [Actinomyces gerencseriae]
MNANTGVITLIVLAVIAALALLAAALILLLPTRRRNGRPPVRRPRPLHLSTIDTDRAQEHWDIARRAARLKWQQDHAALQAARAIQQVARRYGNK